MYYHPGRRKRYQIMTDLAYAAAFGQTTGRRDSYELRTAQEAVMECITAFDGKANRNRCTKAVQLALDCSPNKAREVIEHLKAKERFVFVQQSCGKCARMTPGIDNAMRILEKLESAIRRVIEAEAGNIEVDVSKDVALLKEHAVYYAKSDLEMDADMKAEIREATGEDQKDDDGDDTPEAA